MFFCVWYVLSFLLRLIRFLTGREGLFIFRIAFGSNLKSQNKFENIINLSISSINHILFMDSFSISFFFFTLELYLNILSIALLISCIKKKILLENIFSTNKVCFLSYYYSFEIEFWWAIIKWFSRICFTRYKLKLIWESKLVEIHVN